MQERLSLELAQGPNKLQPIVKKGQFGPEVSLVDPFEIAMGKWRGLSMSLAGRKYTAPDYVRHPMDLATMSTPLELAFRFRPKPLADMVADRRGPAVTQALRELHDPIWEANYEIYLDRMGKLPLAEGGADAYPGWKTTLERVSLLALSLNLVPRADRAEVWRMTGLRPPAEEGDREAGRNAAAADRSRGAKAPGKRRAGDSPAGLLAPWADLDSRSRPPPPPRRYGGWPASPAITTRAQVIGRLRFER